jgi:hypothetical protein
MDDRVDAVGDSILFSSENQSDLQAKYQTKRSEANETAEKAAKDGTLPKGYTEKQYADELYEAVSGPSPHLTEGMMLNYMDVHHHDELMSLRSSSIEPTMSPDGSHVGFMEEEGDILDAAEVRGRYGNSDGNAAQVLESAFKTISKQGMPEMPYQKTNDVIGFMLKRQIDTAMREGKDGIGWGMGDDITVSQNNFIRKNLDEVRVTRSREPYTQYDIRGYKNGEEVVQKDANKANLGNYIGKKNAEVVLEGEPDIIHRPIGLGERKHSTDLNATLEWGETVEEGRETIGYYYPESGYNAFIIDMKASGLQLEDEYLVIKIGGGQETFDNLEDAESYLHNHINEEMGPRNETRGFKFEGDDLQIGGHGNKVYYDEMTVNEANKLFKKHGMKVERELSSLNPDYLPEDIAQGIDLYGSKNEFYNEMVERGEGKIFWKLKFTDAFKKEWAEKGQSLFSAIPLLASHGAEDIAVDSAGRKEGGNTNDITELLRNEQ